jgi:PRC-barrel domain/Domain of unknown function (DUF2382)
MPSPSIESARGWLGRTMVDRDSNKIGEIVDIYLDSETDQPEWAVVRTGLFGMRSTFVPLAEATDVDDEVQVPHHRMEVKQAPNIEPGGQLSEAEEAELYRHYGLDYDTVALANGASADQAQAGPAGGLNEPGSTTRAGATAIPVPEQASTPADTGIDAEPDTTTPETRSASFNPQPDTSSMEAAQGRDAGEEPATPAGSDPLATAGQDRLPAGEEDGRPFVYETPGRPEGNAATRRRQAGQVRLRRYLVTEVVTETESGQRHEVRVQREPVSDTEVNAATAAPDPQSESIVQEPTGSDHNDWFTDPNGPRR